jgi:hypothetical protein
MQLLHDLRMHNLQDLHHLPPLSALPDLQGMPGLPGLHQRMQLRAVHPEFWRLVRCGSVWRLYGVMPEVLVISSLQALFYCFEP